MKATSWIGVAVSRFNPDVTDRLLASCLKTLKKGGFGDEAVRVLRLPGGFELPWAVQELARARGCEAVVALGCILKGSTPQNEHIARSVIQHLHDIALATRVPVLLGVITPRTHAQALARAQGALDRGREAAEAALEMVCLRKAL
jgi:6,7-dimethyl-8-ribityllumazine synthase